MEAGAEGFADLVNSGPLKFAVLEDGRLMVMPATVDGVEMSHAVLSGGQPVIAAGEVEIAAAGGSYVPIDLRPYSGHFLNGVSAEDSAAVREIALQAFARIGIRS